MKIAVSVITEFLFEHELTVYLCVFDKTSYSFSKKLFSDIREFIDDEYAQSYDDENFFKSERTLLPSASERIVRNVCMESVQENTSASDAESRGSVKNKTLQEYMKAMDKPFAYKLFDLIDKRGMTDVECYKKANVDKKTFSKIKCNPDTYRPSKQTAVAFAIALKLNIDETQDLLAAAGLTLSGSFPFDKIIRYFIQKEIYDIFEINEALFEFDQMLLGV